ncbi:hypothetical protein M406DRAFT_243964, partial [Cryphonectria parasitica EP155]
LQQGRKTSHWMWFIFPQAAGLSTSNIGQHYAIHSIAEARGYLSHNVLGRRLIEAMHAVEDSGETDLVSLFGSQVDADKFKSCLTLFSQAE